MVINNLYYEGQQLPDLDEVDYMSGYANPLQCKAGDTDTVGSTFVFDSKALQRALKHIYEKDFHPMSEIEENLFNETFRIFTEASSTGISQSAAEIPAELKQKIDQGNAVFSAFKVHRMQNDIASQLYDSNGVLKPFERWKKDVHPMLDHHVRHWLRTEYDTAVIRARQAADWQRFEQYADILPNLEWMPSTSAHPGTDHKVFWGTILPLNHPFWGMHRPGDRWNCKCSLSATDAPPTGAPRGGNDPKDLPAPGLDNNPGTDGRLFSDTHPYIANAYDGAKEAVKKYLTERRQKEKPIVYDPTKEKERQKAGRKKLSAWYANNLPIVKEGKFEAKRFEVSNNDLARKVIINRKFYEEVASKYQDDPQYITRLEWARKAHLLFPKAIYVRDEAPVHHKDAEVFKVFEYKDDAVRLEFKCKVNKDGVFLHFMRLL